MSLIYHRIPDMTEQVRVLSLSSASKYTGGNYNELSLATAKEYNILLSKIFPLIIFLGLLEVFQYFSTDLKMLVTSSPTFFNKRHTPGHFTAPSHTQYESSKSQIFRYPSLNI